ncbi:hypothetical protein INT47_007981 [Mucor saturninus]|uniref:Peptidase S8/S53 domain-containing protein n=1 Tax=Mucor saturninus TaxID=64648 RepID=A0A8H7QMW7_9FUNG|nr:hypothetical protein INT47_007981 [Mucor saturninus]
MKSTALLTVTLAFISIGHAQSTRPTHIIKFKHTLNATTAHDFILTNHRAYTLSQTDRQSFLLHKKKIKRRRSQPLSTNSTDTEPKLFLDSLYVDDTFTAVAGIFPDGQFVDYLHRQGNVEYVETNQIYKAQMLLPLQEYRSSHTPIQSYTERRLVSSGLEKRGLLQNAVSPSWGQARITQRERGDMGSYTFDEAAGDGIHVYVLDTGVNTEHLDFGGRAFADVNFVDGEEDQDLGGHGTHVAGKIAGQLYGVSKKVTIHSVKILDKSGDGTTAQMIKGLTHVMQVAVAGKSLINLSLSGPKSRLIDEILRKTTQEYHIPIFVAAGNLASDACFFSPASNPHVFAVGASDINDDVATYSDVGECVRIYAPGSEVESTWIGTQTETRILDGTSMASPHVIGIAAALLSKKSYATVEDLYRDVVDIGTMNTLSFKWSKITSRNNNRLAFLQT